MSRRTGSALPSIPALELIIAVNLRHAGSARSLESPLLRQATANSAWNRADRTDAGLADAEPSRSAIPPQDNGTHVNTKSAQPPRIARSRFRHRDDGRSTEYDRITRIGLRHDRVSLNSTVTCSANRSV